MMEAVILLMIFLVEYVSNKTKGVDLKLFNIITETNESKALIKHALC